MNTFRLAFIFLLISISCHQESSPRLKEKEQDKTTSEVQAHKDIGTTSAEIVSNLKSAKTLTDLNAYLPPEKFKSRRTIQKLDFGTIKVKQRIVTKTHQTILLNLIAHNDTIQYGLIEEFRTYHYKTLLEDSVYIDNQKFIQRYVMQHNEKYCTSKSSQDFCIELTRYYDLVIACGYSGRGIGVQEKKIFQKAESNNLQALDSLITSINPEKQTLAILGYERIKEMNVEIPYHISVLIDDLKTRNSTIFACVGCSHASISLERYLTMLECVDIPIY